MKIAIYDPEPMACGLMAWAQHLQVGLRSLGHECDIVSLTWGGKPRVMWGSPRPGTYWYNQSLDAVGSYRGSAEFFHRYDRVILSTPDVGLQDKEALKNNWLLPKYARALELSGVPFTTFLHSFDYGEKFAPFAVAVTNLSNFTGTGIAHADPDLVLRNRPELKATEWVRAAHPYVMRNETDPHPSTRRHVAGTTGRFAHINGFHLTALTAALSYLPGASRVMLHGASAVSNKPSYTLEVYDILRDQYGCEGTRDGEDAFRPHPWTHRKGTHVIRYEGGYTDAVAVCSTIGTHVSVLSAKESTGCTSYVMLESMDAGCLQVATQLHWRSSFQGWVLNPLDTMPSLKTVHKNELVKNWLGYLGRAITASMSYSDADRVKIVAHNRDVIRAEHDPKITARLVVEALGG